MFACSPSFNPLLTLDHVSLNVSAGCHGFGLYSFVIERMGGSIDPMDKMYDAKRIWEPVFFGPSR
jgi:hypothetical protein